MRRLIDLTCKLKSAHHRIWLNSEARADILWWLKGAKSFNGKTKFVSDLRPPSSGLWSAACREGGGIIHQHDWAYVNFKRDFPELAGEHINVLELLMVLVAARRWGHLWSDLHIQFNCDNSASVAAINKGTSRSKPFMKCLRELFFLSVKFNFRLTAVHISGVSNIFADCLSRLHMPNFQKKFVELFSSTRGWVNCTNHMSFKTFLSLQESLTPTLTH